MRKVRCWGGVDNLHNHTAAVAIGYAWHSVAIFVLQDDMAELFFHKATVAAAVRVKTESLTALEGVGKVVIPHICVYYFIEIYFKLYIMHCVLASCTVQVKFLNNLHLLYHTQILLQ